MRLTRLDSFQSRVQTCVVPDLRVSHSFHPMWACILASLSLIGIPRSGGTPSAQKKLPVFVTPDSSSPSVSPLHPRSATLCLYNVITFNLSLHLHLISLMNPICRSMKVSLSLLSRRCLSAEELANSRAPSLLKS